MLFNDEGPDRYGGRDLRLFMLFDMLDRIADGRIAPVRIIGGVAESALSHCA